MLRISARIRNTRLMQVRACLYKVQIAINIASYWSGNETIARLISTQYINVLAILTYLLGFAFG